MLPNCEEFIPVWFGILKAGAVMSSINTAYKGDFLSWTINLVEAKKLVISDEYLDRLDLIKAELPAARARDRLGTREGARAPTPPLPTSRSRTLMSAPDSEPDGLAYSWTDDARIMFTSGTTGRSKGVIKQNAADYFSARSALESACRAPRACRSRAWPTRSTSAACRSSTPTPRCCAPIRRSSPGPGWPTSERFSVARFWQQAIDAGATTFNSIGAMVYFLWSAPPPRSTGPTACHTVSAAPAPKDVYHEFEERFGVAFTEGYGLTETGRRHDDGPHPAPAPGIVRKGQPRLRGHDRRAGHRPPAAARHPGRDRRRPEDPEHHHARLLRRAGEDRRGLPQPEAPHRRPGAHGRRRLRLLHGPGEGLHPPPGRERLLDGGRAPGRPTTPPSTRRRRSG